MKTEKRKQHCAYEFGNMNVNTIHKQFVADCFGEYARFFPAAVAVCAVVFLLFVVVSCIVQCEMCLWSKQLLSMEP